MSTTGTIKHRKQSVQPDDPAKEMSSGEWNDSLVIAGSGVPDAAPMVRDSSKTDGWGFSKSIWAQLQIISWVPRTMPNANNINGLAWSSPLSMLVAVEVSGTQRVTTSPNGVNWTARTIPVDASWSGVVWANSLGLFIAVASSGSAGQRVMTSPDGITWTLRTAPDNEWRGVTWSPDLGLAVATSGSGTNQIMTSSNGTSWTSRTPPSGSWQHVCWAPTLGLFVAVGASGTYRVMTSPDGITWTGRPTPGDTASWYTVDWSPELSQFVAGGSGLSNTYQTLMTSSDGITWTLQTTGVLGIYGVAWSPELNLWAGIGGFGAIATSPDGVAWTNRYQPLNAAGNALVWADTLHMFVAGLGPNTLNGTIVTSVPLVP
jgi:hypothetical protein